MPPDAILWVRLSDWSAGPWAFVILALAVFRVTSLLVREDGPWEVFARLRHAVGVRYSAANVAMGTNELAKGLTCMWCASVWIGAAFSLAFLTMPEWTFLMSLPLAMSALTVGIERVTQWP